MPIPPSPRRYHCLACHWSKIVVPQSDVLMPSRDVFHSCPKCSHAPLDTQSVGGLAADMGRAIDMFKKWFKW